jgi:hypothetical protein
MGGEKGEGLGGESKKVGEVKLRFKLDRKSGEAR